MERRRTTCRPNAYSLAQVIMDEVGRGTATDDGLSLAFSILYYLHQNLKCRTIFATHYHDLADMLQQGDFDRLSYYKTTIEEDTVSSSAIEYLQVPAACFQMSNCACI